ncbi:putative toxin-antitoxin system toxin component, PIN family [Polynucleobacter sp. 30F-ANTBAC]|jgi:putative PIN family toxin of toxin-antitoxin system|uniref:putative toxin-antitoxin system toxin component, PIN family n=1 Tax=Polynucleobacter sp. 30F-ANTBAC TaxID=2689095 RepID=UPI001C0E1317|nr:putative toxin-antitoxin system toxin component, PIN family [Polynucleobacter sp. 30F-ANTBAC]MBU3600114.1 putative toxin-antitoxin system toxin component, PIN family [Polynucleobacter sp. 30F-ANTBAC]
MRPVVILDTNILLDILVFDDQRAHPLRAALANQELDALATQHTLEELADVISRPQFSLDAKKQAEVNLQWQAWSRLVQESDLQTAPWKCKDRDDQVFINLAFSFRPSTLISKDKMVLKIAKRAIKEKVSITADHNQFLMHQLPIVEQ